MKEAWKLKIRNGYINKNVFFQLLKGFFVLLLRGSVNDREGNKRVIFQRGL